MKKFTKVVAAGGIVVTAAVGTAGAVAASGATDDADTPITSPELERATAAALDHTGQGHVTGTEVGDEDSSYEVEVTLEDGSQVDVQLDEHFNVVDTMADRDAGADSDG